MARPGGGGGPWVDSAESVDSLGTPASGASGLEVTRAASAGSGRAAGAFTGEVSAVGALVRTAGVSPTTSALARGDAQPTRRSEEKKRACFSIGFSRDVFESERRSGGASFPVLPGWKSVRAARSQ